MSKALEAQSTQPFALVLRPHTQPLLPRWGGEWGDRTWAQTVLPPTLSPTQTRRRHSCLHFPSLVFSHWDKDTNSGLQPMPQAAAGGILQRFAPSS